MKKLLSLTFALASTFGSLLNCQSVNHWETAVYNNDIWRYQVGLSEPDTNWRSTSFTDTLWLQGPGGFGYGDNDDNTIIPACTSVYIRITFNVSDTGSIGEAILSADYDDAFVAYLNDTEIARVGISEQHPAYNSTGNEHEATMYTGGIPESFILNKKLLKLCLLQGKNVLAVQVHNSSQTSSDLSSNIFLSFGITNGSVYYSQVPSWFIAPQEFNSSNLPVVVINTKHGEPILDAPKITADMKIIDNGKGQINHVIDTGNIYSGKVGIEIRGKYSASLPQKPYGFETRDSAGNNLNVSLLGMPEENDWVLTANYNDKTFLRNFLAFELFRKMGHYATRTRFCEVTLNDDYQGIYLLGEKIKRDKNRVDIAKLNPDENAGDSLTGGYIFTNDYYTSSDSWLSSYSPLNKPGSEVYFVYYDPKPDVMTTTQKKYLKDYVDAFEYTLYSTDYKDRTTGYRAYIDVSSFVDYFLIGEISRNVDAYKKSRFYYKDKDSKSRLIFSGPVWDLDWAWKDITEDCIHFNRTDGSGWAYKVNECNNWPVPPSWEIRLLGDSAFANRIHDRYFNLRKTFLSQASLNQVIDSVADLLDEAQVRHYQKWKILGINVGTPEYGDQPVTYAGEIDKFKSWIIRRLAWLDKNMIGASSTGNNEYEPILRIFPNPVSDNLKIESDTIISRITIFNIMGKILNDRDYILNNSVLLNVSQFDPGLYIIKIYFQHGEAITRRFVKK